MKKGAFGAFPLRLSFAVWIVLFLVSITENPQKKEENVDKVNKQA